MKPSALLLLLLTAVIFPQAPRAAEAEAPKAVEVITTKLADGVYMLYAGASNNIVSVGDDGVFMVDSGFPEQTPALKQAIAKLSDRPIKYVVTTHWHPDHNGGNETFNREGTVTVAHENVRTRLSHDNHVSLIDKTFPALPDSALPVMTYNDKLTFHFNGGDIDVIFMKDAHTDGDSVVHFRRANVIHAGGVFYNYRYPYVDAEAGGTVDGNIEAVRRVLALADGNTKIIPGHGEIGMKKDLVDYLRMFVATRDRMRKFIKEGQDVDSIIAARPNADFDEVYGTHTIKPDGYIRHLYSLLGGK